MAKRFSATEKWDKAWFRKLSPKNKCFYEYLRDKCDLIGLWEVDFEAASFHIGEEILEEEILKVFKGKILKIKNKLLLINFCKFQYGETLNVKSPIHKKIYDLLLKENLYNTLYNTLSHTLSNRAEDMVEEEDMVKEEDKVKDKDNEKVKNNFQEVVDIFNSVCTQLPTVIKLTTQRKSAIKARIKEYNLETIETVFKKVASTNFLNGVNDKGWTADFDWIINQNNFIKILEGKYKREVKKQYSINR